VQGTHKLIHNIVQMAAKAEDASMSTSCESLVWLHLVYMHMEVGQADMPRIIDPSLQHARLQIHWDNAACVPVIGYS
jgi:hypothetical protein